MTTRLIETEDDIAEGLAWLRAAEPRFAAAQAVAPSVPLRRRQGGFAGLVRIVTGQSVSVASADGVWRRLGEAGAITPNGALTAGETGLRACGLSNAKARCLVALAHANLDYDGLATSSEEAARERLMALPGIGPWTADLYLMFCVGRADIFAPGDMAMQEAARLLFDLPERPTARAFAAMAEPWSPWRAVAARLLWAYYEAIKNREGISS
jgi:DNA-3-methyladenine glycosylase II